MKTRGLLLVTSALLACALAAGVWFWTSGPFAPPESTVLSSPKLDAAPGARAKQATATPPTSSAPSSKSAGTLEARIAALEDSVATLQKTVEARGVEPARVAALEKSIRALQGAMDGISLEKASADREALFAGEDGYVKANEYFEAGKFAIAAEGFLTFIRSHPNHPDTREIMKKARDSFLRAGYKDKAFWVQDEMMRGFPDHAAKDIEELAVIEKNAGMYDRAVEHMAQAAEMAASPEDRLWKRLYWAWYVQLRDGNSAGIAALEQVQREIASSGVNNPKLNEHATRRMHEWRQQVLRK